MLVIFFILLLLPMIYFCAHRFLKTQEKAFHENDSEDLASEDSEDDYMLYPMLKKLKKEKQIIEKSNSMSSSLGSHDPDVFTPLADTRNSNETNESATVQEKLYQATMELFLLHPVKDSNFTIIIESIKNIVKAEYGGPTHLLISLKLFQNSKKKSNFKTQRMNSELFSVDNSSKIFPLTFHIQMISREKLSTLTIKLDVSGKRIDKRMSLRAHEQRIGTIFISINDIQWIDDKVFLIRGIIPIGTVIK